MALETQDIRIARVVSALWVRPPSEYVAHIGCAGVSYRLATFLTDIRLVLDAPLVELRIVRHCVLAEKLPLDFFPQVYVHREPRIHQRLISP